MVGVNDVIEAVSKLNMSKRDGSNGLSTTNFKFAFAELFVHVVCLLYSILIQGPMPEDVSDIEKQKCERQ
jgi:hypothetical protein